MTFIFVRKKQAVVPRPDPWTPSDLSTVPEYWLDASSITGLVNNDQLNAWPNQGALADMARDSTNSEPGYPRYRTNQLNGLPGIEWPEQQSQYGTRMNHGAPYVSAAGNLTDITVVAVARSTNSSTGRQLIVRSSTYELISGRTANRWGVGFWNGGFSATTGTTVIDTANAYLLCGQWDKANGTRTLWVGGTQDAQSTGLGANTYNFPMQVVLGSNSYGATPGQTFTGFMHEVIVLHETANETTRQKLEGYLAHKWGLAGSLPAAHPYKSVAPTQ